MKEHPMLFQDALVRAILDGRKTVTRRPVTRRNVDELGGGVMPKERWAALDWSRARNDGHRLALPNPSCPEAETRLYAKWEEGDVIWVREAWAHCQLVRDVTDEACSVSVKVGEGDHVAFRADPHPEEVHGPWRPSIHMPRWACRLTLDITDVIVERVQDITEEEAKREGVEPHAPGGTMAIGIAHRDGFEAAWRSIYDNHPKRPWAAWDANPYVWRIAFKVREVAR